MQVPTRHSDKAVERYRPFIELVSQNYPNPIVVDPAPLSPDTFACRFRDAVAGILRYGSGPDLLDEVSVWAGDYIVATLKGSGQLAIGKTDVVKNAMKDKGGVGKVIDASIAPIELVESPSELVLNALLVLMEYHVLEHVTISGADEKVVREKVSKLTNRVVEVINQNGTITLL